jgi:predicted aminopeptidase
LRLSRDPGVVKRGWLMATGVAALGTAGVMLLAAGTVCVTSGCSTLGYYAQSVGGHLAIVSAAKPVPEWLADSATPPALKQRLELSQRMRDFAVTELKEPDNASYRRYADLKRNAAIWNVVAAPELSLSLKTWCFAVVGCVGYRGYYKEADAKAFADGLRADGLEVGVYGVPAYSTLGLLPFDVFADPLLNTFIDYPEGELARLIFHELAHQIAFAKGDTVFNESFATSVETIGGKRWLQERSTPAAVEEYERYQSRRADFAEITTRYRDRFNTLYGSTETDAQKRIDKAKLLDELHADYAMLKRDRWGGYSGYDGWFARANNASFGVLAAYNQLVPNFERLFARDGDDFTRFYADVKRIAALPPDERRAQLP